VKAVHLIALALLAALVLAAEPALAAKAAAPPAWKVYWDWGWKIINFLILAFLIVKMAKKPLKDFFTNQRAQVAAELEEMNKAKAEAEAELKVIQEQTAGLARELEEFEQALTQTAERDRRRMLEEARNESELILERAQLQAEMALDQARRKLAAEIVDLASNLAAEKLREAVGAADQTRLLDEFAANAQAAKS
jgi:F-type H+-transporting ATPase subunit b